MTVMDGFCAAVCVKSAPFTDLKVHHKISSGNEGRRLSDKEKI